MEAPISEVKLTKWNKFKLWLHEINLRRKSATNNFFLGIAKFSIKIGGSALCILVACTFIKGIVPDFILPVWVTQILTGFSFGGVTAYVMGKLTVSDAAKQEMCKEVGDYENILKKIQTGEFISGDSTTSKPV